MATKAEKVEAVRVKITRKGLGAESRRVLKSQFGLDELPLAKARVEIELKGVPTAVVNALRRTVMDEMPGRALRVPADGFDAVATTDVFMLPQFVNQRIELIPLRPQIPAKIIDNLRLTLDVTNSTAVTRAVYAGDLRVEAGAMPEPLFNPTFQLATLNPGRRIVVRGIYIGEGVGRSYAAHQVARRAAHRHLDLPQHTEAEMKDAGGAALDLSGYKVSCLVADPRHHLLTATIAAAPADHAEARSVFVDACTNLKGRLRLIATAIERGTDEKGTAVSTAVSTAVASGQSAARFAVVDLGEGLAEASLQMPGETDTIGALLKRLSLDADPELAFAGHTISSGALSFRLSTTHGNPGVILMTAVRRAITIFDTISVGINAF